MKRFLALLLILLSTTGCGDASDQNGVPDLDRPEGETPPAQDQGSLTAAEPQISGHADGAPPGCGPRDIAQRAADMFAAISRGDPDVVEVYMGRSRGAPFQWYSMTEGIPSRPEEKNHFVAYRFDDLEGYLRKRHQHGEQIQLRSIKFNGWESLRGIVHMGPIELRRDADDLPTGLGGPERLVTGKGAYHCETEAFIVLSFAMTMVR